MRRLFAIIYILFCAFVCFAIEVVDGSGRCFSFKNSPKVVSIAPVVTDLIFAIGAEDNLLAVSAFCDTQGMNIKRIGSSFGLDWEKLVELNPELVICSYVRDNSLRSRLQECGIKYLCLNEEGLANTASDIRLLGKIFSKQVNAEKLARKFEDTIKKQTKGNRPKAIFLLGSVAAGAGSFVGDVLKAGGFENCVDKISSPWPVLSREFILGENPDVLFFTASSEIQREFVLSNIKDDIAWKNTNAVKNNRIYFVPFDDIILPSVRVLNAIEHIRKIRDNLK